MKRYAAILILSATLGIFLLSGCNGDRDELSRYPKIAIPGYAAKEYYSLTFDKNNEVVYNAVCNLLDDASSMGYTLSDKKADKKSEKFILALKTQQRILELLRSNDDKIASASLRFLQLFSPKYDRKEELVESVLKVRDRGKLVRYERLAALSAMAAKKSPVSEVFLRKSLKDASWLVSRAAYGLINSLENEKVRAMLIARYRTTRVEYEKLLILTSMTGNFSSDVFKFLSKEAFETKNERIKDLILPTLKNARDTAEVLKWVDENYEKLSLEGIAKMVDGADISDDFACAAYLICIRKGWVPDNDFFGMLYQDINTIDAASPDPKNISADDIKRNGNIRSIEKAVIDSKAAGDKWLSFKSEKDAFAKNVCSEIMSEYDAMVKQFSQNVNIVLDKHNVSPEKKKDFNNALLSVFLNKESFNKAVAIFKATEP